MPLICENIHRALVHADLRPFFRDFMLFVYLGVRYHAKDGPINRKMVVDRPLAITSIGGIIGPGQSFA